MLIVLPGLAVARRERRTRAIPLRRGTGAARLLERRMYTVSTYYYVFSLLTTDSIITWPSDSPQRDVNSRHPSAVGHCLSTANSLLLVSTNISLFTYYS